MMDHVKKILLSAQLKIELRPRVWPRGAEGCLPSAPPRIASEASRGRQDSSRQDRRDRTCFASVECLVRQVGPLVDTFRQSMRRNEEGVVRGGATAAGRADSNTRSSCPGPGKASCSRLELSSDDSTRIRKVSQDVSKLQMCSSRLGHFTRKSLKSCQIVILPTSAAHYFLVSR
ncbi:hypothetical protein BCV69DRAFT_192256 [Microstroma glucosiphilum]|uniref:Uncharacterized protein n=1 Tax=Pseudomicrostroma glucosiphilum TaxID=1684307 RepID=A0A316UC26_9BASI|nr:hypothetical protein BCV69DRAFT_192256 [Pseudomicrostroma glucosiphilum]PWN20555.1 hypothetical protein BCV69DRAFT_192256 [Pseudomicrostroma glucosiphilum]